MSHLQCFQPGIRCCSHLPLKQKKHVNIHTLIYFPLLYRFLSSLDFCIFICPAICLCSLSLKTCLVLILLHYSFLLSFHPLRLSIFLYYYSFCLVLQDGGVAALVESASLLLKSFPFLSSLSLHLSSTLPSLLQSLNPPLLFSPCFHFSFSYTDIIRRCSPPPFPPLITLLSIIAAC